MKEAPGALVKVKCLKKIVGFYDHLYGEPGNEVELRNWGFNYRDWNLSKDRSYYEANEKDHKGKYIVLCGGQGYWIPLKIGEDIEIIGIVGDNK